MGILGKQSRERTAEFANANNSCKSGKRKIEISNFRGKIIMFSVQISPQKPSLQWLAEPKQEEINNNKFLNKKIKIIHNRTDSFKNHKIITYENFFFVSTHYNNTLKKKRLFFFDKQDQA